MGLWPVQSRRMAKETSPTHKQQWRDMHPDLAKRADAAITRHKKRSFMPPMRADKDFAFEPPYRTAKDQERWWALFFEALGTRQCAVVTMFFRQLESLIDRQWRSDWEQWVADEEQMIAAFALIESLKPRNVAQAALAAQLLALHISTMKLAKGATCYQHGDARTTATLARSIRAYGDGLMTMRRLQGKGGSRSKQVITVEKHTHTHQHIHIEGESNNGGQPYRRAARAIAELRSLPSSEPVGFAVPRSGDEGKAGLPQPRGRKPRRSER
jgi:hypothetical protein